MTAQLFIANLLPNIKLFHPLLYYEFYVRSTLGFTNTTTLSFSRAESLPKASYFYLLKVNRNSYLFNKTDKSIEQ